MIFYFIVVLSTQHTWRFLKRVFRFKIAKQFDGRNEMNKNLAWTLVLGAVLVGLIVASLFTIEDKETKTLFLIASIVTAVFMFLHLFAFLLSAKVQERLVKSIDQSELATKAFAKCLESFFPSLNFCFESFDAITTILIDQERFYCEIRNKDALLAFGVVEFVTSDTGQFVVTNATSSTSAPAINYCIADVEQYWKKEGGLYELPPSSLDLDEITEDDVLVDLNEKGQWRD